MSRRCRALVLALAATLLAACGGGMATPPRAATVDAAPDAGASDLEALLPGSANGVPFRKESGSGYECSVDMTEDDTLPLRDALQAQGATPADLECAAISPVKQPDEGFVAMVVRLRGHDASKLGESIIKSGRQFSPEVIAGKRVLSGGSYVVYPKGDLLFVLSFGFPKILANVGTRLCDPTESCPPEPAPTPTPTPAPTDPAGYPALVEAVLAGL